MGDRLVWTRHNRWLSEAELPGGGYVQVRRRDGFDDWEVFAQFDGWSCERRCPTEADARAACERLADRIGGER